MKKIIVLGFAALVLTACASIAAIDPAKQADVGDGISVSPQIAWGRVGSGNDQFWTVDGIGLNELHFYTGVESGKSIVNVWSSKDRADIGLYNETMLPNDVMDLVTRTLGKMGYTGVRAVNLTPAPFGSGTGFRFDLTLASRDGLELKGMALTAQRNHKLDLLLFVAPAEYYFAKGQPTVERVFGTLQTTG